MVTIVKQNPSLKTLTVKKLIIIMLIIASGSSYAQITLENNYTSSYVPQGFLSLVKLSSSGYKYSTYDTSIITLYNLNHTVFRTINIPHSQGGTCGNCAFSIFYIS